MDERGRHTGQIRLLSLPQLAPLGRWQLELPHDRPDHLLLWITRGQALGIVDGARCGVGIHNAIFIPAGHVFTLDTGRQCFGQALAVPVQDRISLPDHPVHLRIREAVAQNELAGLLDAINREQSGQRALCTAATRAYAELIGIWVQRQFEQEAQPGKPSAAHRLCRSFFTTLADNYRTGDAMADFARHLGVTPTHLTRVCKAQTGQTAAALLTGRILHAARSDLLETPRSARAIAENLGFASAAYFTRFIQHHTGTTPTGLRRSAA